MIFKPDPQLQRLTSIALVLYVWAFLGQALCVFGGSHTGSDMAAGMEDHALYALASTAAPTSSHGTGGGSPEHGEHSGASGKSHAGPCAIVACGSAVTTTSDEYVMLMNREWNAPVAYPPGTMPPDTETVHPPPRLG